ncbi:MAG: AI-2E family transporter [Crocinitomicaceae bacterium]|nr:AI-2E family transporter [Crocinitomicaceae bacterium]
MKINNIASALLVILIAVVALILAKPVIIPFLIALLIWFLVKKMRNVIDNAGFMKRFIPTWIKTIIASFFIISLLVLISKMVLLNIENISESMTRYSSNIERVADQINQLLGINIGEEAIKMLNDFEFESYLNSLFNSISEVIGSTVMITFYTIFLFFEEALFERKINLIFTNPEQKTAFSKTINKIEESLSSYLTLKSLISLLTTTLSYFVLLAIGVDSAPFWAFLIFMFNFIPSVGPIMGTVLPALFSLIQFGEITPFLITLISLGLIATLVGSLVEPSVMGNTLNISPLVTILSLAVWGAIWGITGMLLSVPITVTMIILFSQFSSTKGIAILMSEKGRI